MAPTCPKTRSSTLSLKLLIDTKSQRVLYAEAGKDVVDFVFSLLTLPVGTVVKILSQDAMVGSVGNLYGSAEKLDETYFRSADAKDALLAPPAGGGYNGGNLLQLPEPEAAASTEFYRCSGSSYTECQTLLTEAYGDRCHSKYCSGKMTTVMKLVDSSSGRSGRCGAVAAASTIAGTGFVQEVVTYTVMDDLTVAPMSTISGIAALKGLGVTDISLLQEKAVRVGYNEGLEMLRASLQSKTVLTDVFLGTMWKEKDDAAGPSNNKKKRKATSSQKKKQRTSCRRKGSEGLNL